MGPFFLPVSTEDEANGFLIFLEDSTLYIVKLVLDENIASNLDPRARPTTKTLYSQAGQAIGMTDHLIVKWKPNTEMMNATIRFALSTSSL